MPSPVDSINTGTANPGSVFNVYFAPNGYTETYDFITSEGWNSFERGQFEALLQSIEDVADIEFNTVNSAANADYVLVLDTNESYWYGADTLGYMYLPTGYPTQLVGVFNGAIWDRSPGGDLEIGGYSYTTILHEMLHGLGLAHPHEAGLGSTLMHGVTAAFDSFGDYDLNQGVYTSLTYNSGNPLGDAGDPARYWGYEATPMALDIAALQDLYGANTTHAPDNDVYVLPGANKTGTHWESIWDTGGKDTIKYGGSKNAVIDLRDATLEYEEGGGGFISSVAGVAGGFTIANGVIIEKATTGGGDDTVYGNNVKNVIKTGGGHDTAYGAGGNDKLKGGTGNDDLFGDAGKDKLIGGSGNDYLFGGNGNDKLKGGGGDDTFDFMSGKDIIRDFGKGADEIWIFESVTGGITDAQQVIELFADDSSDDVIFDFGGGNILTVKNVDNASFLADDILIF